MGDLIFETCGTIDRGVSGAVESIWGCPGLSDIIVAYSELRETVGDCRKLPGAVVDCRGLKLAGTVGDCRVRSGTVGDCQGLSGTVGNGSVGDSEDCWGWSGTVRCSRGLSGSATLSDVPRPP